MDFQETEKAIVKYLTKEGDLSDLDFLSEWIKAPTNEIIFSEYANIHYEITVFMNDPNVESIKKNLLERMRKDKHPFRSYNFKRFFKYAALIIFCFGLGYIFQNNDEEATAKMANDPIITLDDAQITIQMDIGEVKIISESAAGNILNTKGLVVGKQSGNVLAYENNILDTKLIYNTLTVPYGKRFKIVLSDGTKVHLNAGTSLKYPRKFLKGVSREVYLDGEAYFDVVHDDNHPFIVNAKEVSVKVLGTEFNITSYPEDHDINTVLVEGEVEVYKGEKASNTSNPVLLKPGYQATWNKKDKNMTVKQADIEQFTAWMTSRLILDEETFENILKKLERQYNVSFINNNTALTNRRFTARFDIENIDQVMKSLSISASFKYTVKNNKIIIN